MAEILNPTGDTDTADTQTVDAYATPQTAAELVQGDDHDSHDQHGHGEHGDGYHFSHPMPVPLLLGVFGALTFLTIVTVVQANYNFGSADVWIVMAIATIKASLVAFVFMHLAWDKPFNILLFFGSFVFVALFVTFTLNDSRMTSDSFEPKVDEALPMGTADAS